MWTVIFTILVFLAGIAGIIWGAWIKMFSETINKKIKDGTYKVLAVGRQIPYLFLIASEINEKGEIQEPKAYQLKLAWRANVTKLINNDESNFHLEIEKLNIVHYRDQVIDYVEIKSEKIEE